MRLSPEERMKSILRGLGISGTTQNGKKPTMNSDTKLGPVTCLVLRIRDTKAFQEADKAWPLESWTSEEWKRVEKAAEKELKEKA